MKLIKTAMLAISLAGCATQPMMAPTTLAQYEAAGIITKVDVVQGKYVTLHCKGVDSYGYLGGNAWTSGVAIDAARRYKERLKADYVTVNILDEKGTCVAVGDAGTPNGYHWQENGIEFTNTNFGPVDIHPTYGLERD